MPRESKVQLYTRLVHEQQKWIAEHGGDLAGYVENYGSANDPNKSGNGGEAIFSADNNALLEYENKLKKALQRKKVA